jgi:hypothetical protein
MSASSSNQKSESWVKIAPLLGIVVGNTQSNAEMRSDATSRISPELLEYKSRTFPVRRWFQPSIDGAGGGPATPKPLTE